MQTKSVLDQVWDKVSRFESSAVILKHATLEEREVMTKALMEKAGLEHPTDAKLVLRGNCGAGKTSAVAKFVGAATTEAAAYWGLFDSGGVNSRKAKQSRLAAWILIDVGLKPVIVVIHGGQEDSATVAELMANISRGQLVGVLITHEDEAPAKAHSTAELLEQQEITTRVANAKYKGALEELGQLRDIYTQGLTTQMEEKANKLNNIEAHFQAATDAHVATIRKEYEEKMAALGLRYEQTL